MDHESGYHDGLIAREEAVAQEGFNIGFKESVLVGYKWGLVRGDTRDWNELGVTNCGNETKLLSGSGYRGGLPKELYVVKDVLTRMRKHVHLLDITTLSQLRKDAYPGFYNGFRRMDCNHWCIVGLLDTWNQIFMHFS
nr:protein trichome birefringence-like 40 [Ziziphus jujuba var. spinosa]